MASGPLTFEKRAPGCETANKDLAFVTFVVLMIYFSFVFLCLFAPILFLVLTDTDECSLETTPCDKNADCRNTNGSYSYRCQLGFTGNGISCQGIHQAARACIQSFK